MIIALNSYDFPGYKGTQAINKNNQLKTNNTVQPDLLLVAMVMYSRCKALIRM